MRFGQPVIFAIALVLVGLCGPSTAQTGPPGYEVIAQKSIFLRDRTSSQVDENEDVTTTQVPIEELFVLRGVVFQQDSFRAFVEPVEGGGQIELVVGDKVADGQVVEIQINGIGYRKSGSDELVWVGPGRDLAGNWSGVVSKIRETRR